MIFDVLFQDSPFLERFATVIGFLLALLGAIILHENAHAVVALWNGDDTAKNAGRITLNPVKHFDPMGFMMLLLVGFGFARPVPINPYRFKNRRLGVFTVSIAGVVTNLILAFISSFFCALILSVAAQTSLTNIAFNFFFYFSLINICLALFNLIPIFPLDGFRVLESLMPRGNKFTEFMRRYGNYILLGLVAWSLIIGWACDIVSPEAADVLQYFDILGFGIGFVAREFLYLLFNMWGRVL